MPIFVPDQGEVSLGQSQVRPAETYAPQPTPNFDASRNAEQLANALGKFGSGLGDFGATLAAKQEKEQSQNLEYHANMIRAEHGTSAVTDAQIGAIHPEMSATVRGKVSQILGTQNATQEALGLMEKFAQDDTLRTDITKQNAALEEWRQQAAAKAKGNPFWGNGYLEGVNKHIERLQAAGLAERSTLYTQVQKEGYIAEAEAARVQAANGNRSVTGGKDTPLLRSILTDGKDTSHIDHLNPVFSSRLEAMLRDAPENVRDQLEVISGYRSNSRQKELYDAAVEKWGSPQAARKWVAPPGHSNHNHGEALDFGGGKSFGNTEAGKWVHANADKYGLYFPMGHEPWHIEARGGRRETGTGAGNSSYDENVVQAGRAYKNDGMDTGGNRWMAYASRINGSESGYDANAQSQTSSAGGLGQHVDKTWVSLLRKNRPDIADGKSDADLIRLKTNPALNTEMTVALGKENSAILRKAGLSDNDTNLKVMHFLGADDGQKLLKASDGTRISDVVSADKIAANPSVLGGKTVGQVKEWAARKMDQPVDASMATQNAIRGVDQSYARTSSLSNMARRDAWVEHLTKKAISSGDPDALKAMPPEWINPAIQQKLDEANRQAIQTQIALHNQKRQIENEKRQDDTRNLVEKINRKMISNEPIDFEKDVIGADGKVNNDAFQHALKAKDSNINLTPYESQRTAADISSKIESGALRNDMSELNPEWKGKVPTEVQIRDYINKRDDLRSEEKVSLGNDIKKIIQTAAVSQSPEAQQTYNHRVGDYAKFLTQSNITKTMNGIVGFNFEGKAREFYENEVRSQTKAYIESNNGQMPRGGDLLSIYQNAADTANTHLEKWSKLVNEGIKPDTKQTGSTPQAPAKEAPKVEPKLDAASGKKFIFDNEVPAGVPTYSNGGVNKALINGEFVDVKPKPKDEAKKEDAKPVQVAGATPKPDTGGKPDTAPEAKPAAWNDRIVPRITNNEHGYDLLNWPSDVFNAELIAGKTVGSFLSDGASWIGDLLTGDPQKAIDQVKAGKSMAGPESDLGKAIIAHQEERLKKAKKK